MAPPNLNTLLSFILTSLKYNWLLWNDWLSNEYPHKHTSLPDIREAGHSNYAEKLPIAGFQQRHNEDNSDKNY